MQPCCTHPPLATWSSHTPASLFPPRLSASLCESARARHSAVCDGATAGFWKTPCRRQGVDASIRDGAASSVLQRLCMALAQDRCEGPPARIGRGWLGWRVARRRGPGSLRCGALQRARCAETIELFWAKVWPGFAAKHGRAQMSCHTATGMAPELCDRAGCVTPAGTGQLHLESCVCASSRVSRRGSSCAAATGVVGLLSRKPLCRRSC